MIRTTLQIVWVSFKCKTESSGPDFQLCLLRWYPGAQKSSKYDRNIFQPYWWETIRTAPQRVWVCFGCKTESFDPDFSSLPTPIIPGTGKDVKIRSKRFSSVLMENDMKCAPYSVSMFLVQNRATLTAPGLLQRYLVLEKSSKFDRNVIQPYWR